MRRRPDGRRWRFRAPRQNFHIHVNAVRKRFSSSFPQGAMLEYSLGFNNLLQWAFAPGKPESHHARFGPLEGFDLLYHWLRRPRDTERGIGRLLQAEVFRGAGDH